MSALRAALARGFIVAALFGCWESGTPPPAAAATSLPPQGVYEHCSIARAPAACAARLQRLSAAGFRVVLNGSSLEAAATPSQIAAYAAAAQAANIKLIWPLSGAGFGWAPLTDNSLVRSNPTLALRCGCLDNRGLLAYLIGVLRRYPATWGYYLADEPQPERTVPLASLTQAVAALDPQHKRLIMGCGICSGHHSDVSWLGSMNAVLGTDSYPVFFQEPDEPDVTDRVGRTVAALQRVADPAGRETVVALQAWRWGDSAIDARSAGLPAELTRFPTRREIEMQRNAAIANGRPSLILWFMLPQVIGWVPGQRPENWAQPPDPDERWRRLVGGAFAPLPNEAPSARIDLKGRRAGKRLRLVLDGRRSRDEDGRIVKWRWRVTGRRGTACATRRCLVRVPRRSRLVARLTVVDDRGAEISRKRRIRVPRTRWAMRDPGSGPSARTRRSPWIHVTRPYGNLVPPLLGHPR